MNAVHHAVRTVKLTTILLMASAARGILRSQFAEAADNSSAELQELPHRIVYR